MNGILFNAIVALDHDFSHFFAFEQNATDIVTDALYGAPEPLYPTPSWYPAHVGTVNRFLAIDGQSRERLVVVPVQFRDVGSQAPTVGTQRLYDELSFEVYHAPFTATDFIAPSIWQVEALSNTKRLVFRAQAEDDSGEIQRTVVLYRTLNSNTWSKVELNYNPATGWAKGSTEPVSDPIEYFAQTVDPTGNVALALDHGVPFNEVKPLVTYDVYLPVVLKGH